jgi:hypothetical protein
MLKPIYIVLGNHKSTAGIIEIVYSLYSCLSENFSIELSRNLKKDCINIIIDEFSAASAADAIGQMKARYPNTKIVIIATEFVTPVSICGVKLMSTFNFFASPRDWRALLAGVVRSLRGGTPSYMRLRYLGFVRALRYCDLVAVIHPQILSGLSQGLDRAATSISPLPLYPQIGPLSSMQQDRLQNLPIGFTMTGTQTPYRRRMARKLAQAFQRGGWLGELYKHYSFESSPALLSAVADTQDDDLRSASSSAEKLRSYYAASAPDYLFNLNPPQTAKWPYSSPMRILRAILVGQIPVVTKKFGDHPIENIALQWGDLAMALARRNRQFLDRSVWLSDYCRSLDIYDRQAREVNGPFVRAIAATTNAMPGGTAEIPTRQFRCPGGSGLLTGENTGKFI